MDTINGIIRDGESIFNLPDYAVNRMLVCGKCPKSKVDPAKAKEAFRAAINTLVEKIDRYNEWGGANPEAKREYREKNREEIKAKATDRRMEQRIAKLKGGSHG